MPTQKIDEEVKAKLFDLRGLWRKASVNATIKEMLKRLEETDSDVKESFARLEKVKKK